jgi:hypothetical protein
MVKEKFSPLSDGDLSRFWYCPEDSSRLQPKLERVAQNPFFKISRGNISTSMHNAVALRKIPESALSTTEFLINYMFENLSTDIVEIDLVGTECPTCQTRFASPKLNRVLDLHGKSTGKALYDSQKMLATKNYGRFRVVDRFGLGKDQSQTSSRSGMRNIWFLGFFFGFANLILVMILYYIMGLEMKLGNKFIPLGPLLILFVLISIFYGLLFFNLIEPIANALRRYR